MAAPSASAVPDILAPALRCVFCGINPGQHFANPRNDFWRLLADSGLIPRRLDPAEQWDLLELGYGLTNAAYRTTKGSGDLRRSDLEGSADRLERPAAELRPGWIAFVGKSAFQGPLPSRSSTSGTSCRATRVSRSPTRSSIAGSRVDEADRASAGTLGRRSWHVPRATGAHFDATLASGWWERGARD